MRKSHLILLILLIALISFVIHTLLSTGFFKEIENSSDYTIIKELNIVGAEDIAISHSDSFAIISSTNREKFPAKKQESGDIYRLDLKTNSYDPVKLSRPKMSGFAPHGISLLKKDSSYLLFAINHIGDKHSIEVFEILNDSLAYLRTLADVSMISPNDVCAIGELNVYFTNDHAYTKGIGKFVEEYGGFAWGNVVHYSGDSFNEVAEGIAYANGINIDKDRNLAYVASPRSFGVKVYDISSGNFNLIDNIKCGTGVDNIDIDKNGELWIGAHPDLLHFAAYAKGKKNKSPSEIIHIVYNAEGDYQVESSFVDDGTIISGSSVAARFGDLILLGTVMDNRLLILKDDAID